MTSIDELRIATARPPVRVEGTDHASVAAVFTPELELLLLRRADRPGDPWSGHVALPGGRIEDRDEDAVAAAIRETQEEVGLRLRRPQLLGPLDEISAVGGKPGLVIRPFVFLANESRPELTLQAEEVADVRWVSIQSLLQGQGRGAFHYEHLGAKILLPRVDFNHWRGVRLWGLTLRMIDDLLHRLDGRGLGLDRPGSTDGWAPR